MPLWVKHYINADHLPFNILHYVPCSNVVLCNAIYLFIFSFKAFQTIPSDLGAVCQCELIKLSLRCQGYLFLFNGTLTIVILSIFHDLSDHVCFIFS